METRRGVSWPNDMAGITMELDWDVDEAERRGLHATVPARARLSRRRLRRMLAVSVVPLWNLQTQRVESGVSTLTQ
jgi:hypothetical protein